MAENSMMSLSISKDMLTPVIEQQVKAMMIEILGGKELIVDDIITKILHQKVDKDGKPSTWQGDKQTYFDWLLVNELTKAVKELIHEEITSQSGKIRKQIKKAVQTEKGANTIAQALLDGLGETVKSSWRSSLKIELHQTNND